MGKIKSILKIIQICMLFLLYSCYLAADMKQKNCDEIEENMGFYLIKYTYVKYTGVCFLYNNSEELQEIMSFENGKKNGIFKKYSGGKIIEEFYMKNNELNGIYKKFRNGILYKEINYQSGKITNCYVDLNYVMELEKRFKKLDKVSNSDSEDHEKLKRIKFELQRDKENCEVKRIN